MKKTIFINIYEDNSNKNININIPRKSLNLFPQPRINNSIKIYIINTNNFTFNNFNSYL